MQQRKTTLPLWSLLLYVQCGANKTNKSIAYTNKSRNLTGI